MEQQFILPPLMRSWMSKYILIIYLSSISQRAIANESFFGKINDFVFNIENKTKVLFDDGKLIGTSNNNQDNLKNSNSFMIQKEKEKLNIIPMFPLEMKQENYNLDKDKMGHRNKMKLFRSENTRSDYDDYYDYDYEASFENPSRV